MEKIKTNSIKYFLLISVFFLAVFVLALAVWYGPVLLKGYAPYKLTDGPLLARNIDQSGLYSIESDLNVLLPSDSINDQGIVSAGGNKLTVQLYSKVMGITGLFEADDLIWLSIFIYALTLLIFTGIVLYLFDFKIASIFSLVYIFLPFNWLLPYYLCTYEFALLFLSLFFFFYIYVITKERKFNYIYLIASGILLALACLSRETLLLIVPFLLIFLWIKYPKKYLLYIFIPFFILLAFLWLPNISHDAYLQVFTIKTSEEAKSADFNFYGHIYPDPYTYHFEKEEFLGNLQNQINENNLVLAKEIDLTRELKNIGIVEISLFDRLRAGLMLGARHIFRFISLEDIGGPFVFLLILLGLYTLKKKNQSLYHFFIYWIISTVFLMSFVALVGRNHLMDFNWAIALLISLGLLALVDHFKFENKKATLVYLVVLLAVLYHLITVGHIVWSRTYDNNNNLMIQAYSQEIKALNIKNSDVIAVNLESADISKLVSYRLNL